MNLAQAKMTQESTAAVYKTAVYVTYCDGIGCSASNKGAPQMTRLGFTGKELLGWLDWWKRDGDSTEGPAGRDGRAISCGS